MVSQQKLWPYPPALRSKHGEAKILYPVSSSQVSKFLHENPASCLVLLEKGVIVLQLK